MKREEVGRKRPSKNNKAHSDANQAGFKNQIVQGDYSMTKAHQQPTTIEMLANLHDAMLATIGYAPNQILTDGLLHRFDTLKKGDKAGWYVCHATRWGLVARFADWREGVTHPCTSFNDKSLSKSDYQELRVLRQQQVLAKQAEDETRHQLAQTKAMRLWAQASPAHHAHPYLIRKQIQAYGARQLDEKLIVPIYDFDGILHNLQTIALDGTKRFLLGGRKRGLFYPIGLTKQKPKHIYIAEGFATAASLYEAYGLPVLVAFDAGNLLSVTMACRLCYASTPILICADNDRHSLVNTGLIKAKEVQSKVAGVDLLIPHFPAGAPVGLTDFNDLIIWTRSMEATL